MEVRNITAFFDICEQSPLAITFSLHHPTLDVVVLTLNSARERRMAEVIIEAYAACVSRFVKLITATYDLTRFSSSFIHFIAISTILRDCLYIMFKLYIKRAYIYARFYQ